MNLRRHLLLVMRTSFKMRKRTDRIMSAHSFNLEKTKRLNERKPSGNTKIRVALLSSRWFLSISSVVFVGCFTICVKIYGNSLLHIFYLI